MYCDRLISQIRGLRPREMKCLAPEHKIPKWRSQDRNFSLPDMNLLSSYSEKTPGVGDKGRAQVLGFCSLRSIVPMGPFTEQTFHL